MFNRSKKPGSGFAVLPYTEPEMPKYSKPKILLIDLKDDSEAVLKNAGFNVASGTFGTPYHVPKTDEYQPLIPNLGLQNCEEQEIVFIDLLPDDALDQPVGDKLTSEGENDWWVKHSLGWVDPRPRAMLIHQTTFDRILEHGGVFIVFTDSREHQQMLFGRKTRSRGLEKEGDIPFDNWSFLSMLTEGNLLVLEDRGEEMLADDQGGDLDSLFARHLKGARFYCSFRWKWYGLTNDWRSLFKNKYGASVGGLLLPDKQRKGLLFLIPQLEKKAAFISDMLTTVLPSLVPELFPHVEGARWVERPDYELPKIIELKNQIDEVQTAAKSTVEKLEKEINAERTKSSFVHDLIRETDEKLVYAVKQALEVLGFKNIVNVDEQKKKDGDSSRDEDLQIHDYSPLLLVEVKGVNGTPSDDEALQVAKHIAPRMKQLKKHDIQGLTIINHQRHIPALERQNAKPFRDVILHAANKQEVGLLTTWDLFRLIRSYLKNGWTHAHVKDLFYRTGRIFPIPSHYSYLGVVDEYWEKASALSVKLEQGEMQKRARIAFELPVEFVEQTIESMQLDGQPIEKASKGSVVGIKTTLTKEQAKKGTNVYLIGDPA